MSIFSSLFYFEYFFYGPVTSIPWHRLLRRTLVQLAPLRRGSEQSTAKRSTYRIPFPSLKISTIFLCFFFAIFSSESFSQQKFQLAPPVMQYRSVFYKDTAMLVLKFDQPGTTIHYSFNGKEPGENDFLYTQPVIIKDKIAAIKARTVGENFLPSDAIQITFIKDGLPVQSVEYTKPNAKYPGNGKNTLIDNEGGFAQSSSKTWMGFQNDTVNIEVTLTQTQKVKEVLLNFLQDEGGWIFLPETINVYAYNNEKSKYDAFGTDKPFTNKSAPGSNCVYRIIETEKKIKTEKLLLQIITVKQIPDWHDAKGNHAWMFIDELKVY